MTQSGRRTAGKAKQGIAEQRRMNGESLMDHVLRKKRRAGASWQMVIDSHPVQGIHEDMKTKIRTKQSGTIFGVRSVDVLRVRPKRLG